jgi:hypothetical protein
MFAAVFVWILLSLCVGIAVAMGINIFINRKSKTDDKKVEAVKAKSIEPMQGDLWHFVKYRRGSEGSPWTDMKDEVVAYVKSVEKGWVRYNFYHEEHDCRRNADYLDKFQLTDSVRKVDEFKSMYKFKGRARPNVIDVQATRPMLEG